MPRVTSYSCSEILNHYIITTSQRSLTMKPPTQPPSNLEFCNVSKKSGSAGSDIMLHLKGARALYLPAIIFGGHFKITAQKFLCIFT